MASPRKDQPVWCRKRRWKRAKVSRTSGSAGSGKACVQRLKPLDRLMAKRSRMRNHRDYENWLAKTAVWSKQGTASS